MNIDVEVKGLKEVEQFLKTLPVEVQTKMAYGALMGGALPIMRQAKTNVQQQFGRSARYTYTLEEALVRGRNKRTGLAARVDVKIRKGRVTGKTVKMGVTKPYGDDAFYGRFLEFGTSKMNSHPFLLPAAMARSGESAQKFNATMIKRMAKWCGENGVTFKPGAGV
jgi:HK97 gp10 family phage protein